MHRCLWIAILALIVAVPVVMPPAAATASHVTNSNQSRMKVAKSKCPTKPSPQPKRMSLPKIVDLGSDMCIPCKMMVPVLDQLKKEYKGKLLVEFIDVGKNPAAKDKYRVRMIPTQILYDSKGKELFRHLGYWPKDDIIAEFKKHGIKLSR